MNIFQYIKNTDPNELAKGMMDIVNRTPEEKQARIMELYRRFEQSYAEMRKLTEGLNTDGTRKFMDRFMNDECDEEAVHGCINRWHHNHNISEHLDEYLGLTDKEYQEWIEGSTIAGIRDRRRSAT